MVSRYIKYAIKNRLAYITLNRSDKRNAFNYELIAELKDAFGKAEKDKRVKIIILNANGNVFSAGADLEYLQKLQKNSFKENLSDSTHLAELFKKIYFLKKIVIAQVEGHAIAGGCGLATVCDFAFAIPEAQFGYTEVKIGFIPAIVLIFLLRKIGEAKAKELLLTGKLMDAVTAKDFGLINFISSKEKIKSEVEKFALTLCEETSAESLSLTKEMIGKVQAMKLDDALKFAAKMNAQARSTDDCKKGIASFLSKEKIKW